MVRVGLAYKEPQCSGMPTKTEPEVRGCWQQLLTHHWAAELARAVKPRCADLQVEGCEHRNNPAAPVT